MSASAYPEYNEELKVSSWEKAKDSGFDAKSDVADKLKALRKRHDAVDWKLFAPGWTKAARTADELEAEGSRRHKTFSNSVLPLKKDALALISLIRAAERKADKKLQATLKTIGSAAEVYAEDIDKCGEALKSAYEKAADALPEDEDEDSVPSALVSPKLLLKQLTLCRKDPERTMKFAFVDAGSKNQPALLALHPRMSARALFGKLQVAAGVKTGAYGSAWVDGMSLMLQLDKPLSGLVKKVRPAVKASGFRISKAVIWNEDGTVFEQDDTPDEAAGESPTGTASPAIATPESRTAPPSSAEVRSATPPTATPPVAVNELQARLKKLLERHKALVTTHPELKDGLRPLTLPAAELAMKGSAEAPAALDKLEKALDSAEQAGPAASPSKKLEWEADLQRIEPHYLAVLQGQPRDATKIRAVMAYAVEQAGLGAFEKALMASTRLQQMLNTAELEIKQARPDPQADPQSQPQPQPQAQTPAQPQVRTEDAVAPSAAREETGKLDLGDWSTVRQDAVSRLRALARNLAKAKHQRAEAATREVQDVIGKLMVQPVAGKDVAAMTSYLKDDRVVADISRLVYDIRTPLLNGLKALALAA